MKHKLLILSLLWFVSCLAQAQMGMVSVKSSFDVSTTASKLKTALQSKGMTVFAHIEHSDSAEKVGVDLRPTELVIFGNPKVGSPLMACAQSVAIDLPQEALIYEDENHSVWLAYNDPSYLVSRHGVAGCDAVIQKISKALTNFAQKATQP